MRRRDLERRAAVAAHFEDSRVQAQWVTEKVKHDLPELVKLVAVEAETARREKERADAERQARERKEQEAEGR